MPRMTLLGSTFSLLSLSLLMLTGCGGGGSEPTSVAQATNTGAASSNANTSAAAGGGEDESDESYGGEGYGGEGYGGGSGGGGRPGMPTSGEGGGRSGASGMGGDGYGMGGPGYGGGGSNPGDYGDEGYPAGGDGYGMGGPGYGGGGANPGDYGSGSYAGMAGGYGGEPDEGDEGDGYAGYGGPGMGGPGYGGPGYGGPGMGGPGYGGGGPGGGEGYDAYEGYGGGPGMGGPGYGGPGMGGPGYGGPGMGGAGYGGGNNSGNMRQVTQFLSQNCYNCHGPRQSKGGIRLDGLTANFSDSANAKLWSQVLEQLEGGTMPPKNVPRRPDPTQQQRVIAWVKQTMEAQGAVIADEDYLTRAKREFGLGNEKEAIDLLYAHVVTADDEEAKAILEKSRWFAARPHPTTTIRFAAGVVLKAPSNMTDVKPIGTSQLGGAGGGGYGGEGFSGPGGPGQGGGQRSFAALTGDFGEALVGAFETRWSAGELGGIFNDVVAIEPRRPQRGGGPGMGYGGGSYGAGSFGGEGYGGGGFGEDGYGDAGYGAGYGGGGFGNRAGGGRKNILPGKVITPGLVYLGTGSQVELLKKAAEKGVDGLFVFDIEANQNRRTGLVNNETRLRLVLVDGKALAATKTLKNIEVERAQLRGTGDDEVQKNIDRLFALADEKVKLTSLPRFEAEHAKNRLRQLLSDREALPEDDEYTMNMTVLYETRLFFSLGLITEAEMSSVYQIVLEGNEGETLATGTPDDRKLVMDGVLTSFQ